MKDSQIIYPETVFEIQKDIRHSSEVLCLEYGYESLVLPSGLGSDILYIAGLEIGDKVAYAAWEGFLDYSHLRQLRREYRQYVLDTSKEDLLRGFNRRRHVEARLGSCAMIIASSRTQLT